MTRVFLYVSITIFSLTQQEIVKPLQKLSGAPNDNLTQDRTWTNLAIRRMWKERKDMSHTPIFKFNYIGQKHVDIVFKNESASRSGSLKHRYAWALLMWALVEGHVKNGTHVYEASSGNTAASLAYMCRLLNIDFTAIVPDTIEAIKVKHIEDYGGKVVKVPIGERLVRARQLAAENGGFFMNQFGNADKAEEFHESGDSLQESTNLIHEFLVQLNTDENQEVKVPHYFVHAAGTGGTISSIGRYTKKYGINIEIVLADTQFSVYYDYVMYGRFKNESGAGLWVEPGMAGIGYGPMGMARKGETTSMNPAVIDRVVKIPDLAATAAMRVLRDQELPMKSTSHVIPLMHRSNILISNIITLYYRRPLKSRLTIATLLADPGRNYDATYYNRDWIRQKFSHHGGIEAYDCWYSVISDSLSSGDDPLSVGYQLCPAGILS
ncbi:pyridoxal-phosphate dependent protein [Dictyocaulus viviparus]|uniref:Pyridoxal-phosphate dependent protein n=1 Tax=Dictyocaulus viviparus TaxID=29172 RepID=A0A0D8XPM6_DICVI|nr:pyridoxal-phosphate dependent protein [Dictyocaulus viviparus]